MTVFIKPKDIPKKTESDKFVALPPAYRRTPSRQKPFKKKPKGKS